MRRIRPDDLPTMVRSRKLPALHNHAPARKIRTAVGGPTWSGYKTFTVERNPWDRAVSLYFYLHGRKDENRPGFSEFLRETAPGDLSNFHLYAIHGKVAVDRVVRYENLRCGLSEIWEWVGIPGEPELPHAKGSLRPPDAQDYRSMFCDDDAALIARVCREEIEVHGYTFD